MHRAFIFDSFLHLALKCEPGIEYYAHSKVKIDALDKEFPHLGALKFENEPTRMCCASEKGLLPVIEIPPEPDSNMFLKSIRTFNLCFQRRMNHIYLYLQMYFMSGKDTERTHKSRRCTLRLL